MTDDELIQAFKRGAVVNVSDSTGEVKILAHDDLPPEVRACMRASETWSRPGVSKEEKAWAQEHWNTCPDCMENDAADILMEAYSYWDYGDEITAGELEGEAAALRLRAAQIRAARAAA